MKNYVLPMAMAFAGFTMWTVSDAIIRYLNDYPITLITFLGSAMALVFTCFFAPWIGGFKKTFTDPKLGLRMLRGLFLTISGFLSYIAFSNLELPTAYAFIFVAPFIAKIFSIFLTGENIRPRSWAITALGFLGVLIVLRPGMVPISIGSMAALGLSVMFAAGYVLGRYIGPENQTLMSMALFQYLFLTIATAYPAYQEFVNMPADMVLGDSSGVCLQSSAWRKLWGPSLWLMALPTHQVRSSHPFTTHRFSGAWFGALYSLMNIQIYGRSLAAVSLSLQGFC